MSDKDTAAIDELDLLAYADGRLDRDPARKQAVDSYLRAHPEAAARIEAYVAQNEAIRAAYAGVAEDPVPARLLDALEHHPRFRTRALLQATAAAAALAVAAGAGWWVGRWEREPSLLTQSFVEQTMFGHLTAPGAQVGADPAGTGGAAQPMAWLSQRISLELQPPDLSALGFRQVDVGTVEGPAGPSAVRVTYADAANRRINLFLKTRWEERPPALQFVERDGVSMAYWLDGPLVYGLAARIDRETLEEIAGHIRHTAHANGGPARTEGPIIRHQGTLPAGAPEGETPNLVIPAEPRAEGGMGTRGPETPGPIPSGSE